MFKIQRVHLDDSSEDSDINSESDISNKKNLTENTNNLKNLPNLNKTEHDNYFVMEGVEDPYSSNEYFNDKKNYYKS